MQKKRLFLLALGLLLIALGIFYFVYQNLRQPHFGVLQEDILIQISKDEIPPDTLYITQERRDYQRGKMILIIPEISVYTQVGESTSPAGLEKMPGLYEFSQLPGESDGNVSVAGHRDIYDKVFYSLDQLVQQDYAYLLYNDMIYRYIYKDTKIVPPTDWGVIKPQGFSCLTLTTCDPIGTTLNRMIVRWALVDTASFDESYQFIENSNL